jgi:nitronate monooxygenase
MQAPLGRGSGAPLAIAVSAAGGLGTLGASWTAPDALREQIRAVERATDSPFCVNLVLDFEQEERLEVTLEAMAMYAGQGVGAIAAEEPAGEIVERFYAALRR